MSKRKDKRPPVVSLVSLGCAKNTVDSECLLGMLMHEGLVIAEDPADADVCLVNTCGFIHDARVEAAEVLEELRDLKAGRRLKAIAAMGCLVERVADCPELASFLRHADALIAFSDYGQLPKICRRLANRGAGKDLGPEHLHPHAADYRLPDSFMKFLKAPRLRIGSTHTAYLKIAEGCSNLCRFCSIPRIRGLQASRPMEDLLAEARTLTGSSAREINLIAQDTSAYGKDLYGKYRLPDLLRGLREIKGKVWYRLLYAHPRHLSDAILGELAEPPFCPYVDVPLQHITDRMLDAMGRGMTRRATEERLDAIARALPGGAIRTTFIVGYPGETEADFEELLEFVREGRFMHVGVFLYSSEPLTPASKIEDDVPLEIKENRRERLMLAQLDVSRARLRKMVGRDVEVMLEGHIDNPDSAPAGATAFGRTRLQAPDVDGVVFLQGKPPARTAPGRMLRVRVTEAFDYDLVGTIG